MNKTLTQGREIDELYSSNDYMTAYVQHTNMRVKQDYQMAIGGGWNTIGSKQLNILKDLGLTESNRVLDVGCGTLRAGRHIIRYLEAGGYFGMDISPECVRMAKKLVSDEKLEMKTPTIWQNNNLMFDDNEFFAFYGCGQRKNFDFILMWSVFTHLRPDAIKECFENIHKLFRDHKKKKTKWVFTWNMSHTGKAYCEQYKNYYYNKDLFYEYADTYGYNLESYFNGHKYRQKMFIATKK